MKAMIKSIVPDEVVTKKISLIRGQKVMMDRDLAELYGIKAIRLREQVNRNLKRFPGNFMFRLTKKETENMVSQNAIPSRQHLGGYFPYAFTEHGVLMLSNVLKSQRALKMSIRIIEIFVRLREVTLRYYLQFDNPKALVNMAVTKAYCTYLKFPLDTAWINEATYSSDVSNPGFKIDEAKVKQAYGIKVSRPAKPIKFTRVEKLKLRKVLGSKNVAIKMRKGKLVVVPK